ncbi:hypothetical protein D3C78_821200 [compost metagenome]
MQGIGGWLHASGSTIKEFVAKKLPKTLEGATDGRLADAQRIGNTRNFLFLNHQVENQKKIKVEFF